MNKQRSTTEMQRIVNVTLSYKHAMHQTTSEQKSFRVSDFELNEHKRRLISQTNKDSLLILLHVSTKRSD